MEHDTGDLNDPISKKLDDNATLVRLVRPAVADSVERARRLGFLEPETSEGKGLQ